MFLTPHEARSAPDIRPAGLRPFIPRRTITQGSPCAPSRTSAGARVAAGGGLRAQERLPVPRFRLDGGFAREHRDDHRLSTTEERACHPGLHDGRDFGPDYRNVLQHANDAGRIARTGRPKESHACR